MLRAHAPYSIARRAAGYLDFNGSDWSLGFAALSVGSWRSVCESGGEDFFRHFRIPNYDFAAEGIRENFDHSAARILCAAGLPDSSCGDRVHAARVRDLLARVALVSHDRGSALCDKFRLCASVVSGSLVVAERGGTILFFVAGRLEEMVPAQSSDSCGSCGARSGVSRGVPLSEAAWASGRNVSGRGGHSGNRMPAGDFCAATAADQTRLGVVDAVARGSGS